MKTKYFSCKFLIKNELKFFCENLNNKERYMFINSLTINFLEKIKENKVIYEKLEDRLIHNSLEVTMNEISNKKFQDFLDKLKLNSYKKVSFLIGAGISTSAGILDFRSKGGQYEKIREKFKELNDPTDLFNIKFFWKNPQLYYTYNKAEKNDEHFPTKSHV
jgi:hypothetical protein